MFPCAGHHLGEEAHLKNAHQVNLSGLSISQPRNRRAQGGIPRFPGFFAGFLEITPGVFAGCDYGLWFCRTGHRLLVLFTPLVLRCLNACNRSTTDGTKVGVRGTKTISSRLFSAVDGKDSDFTRQLRAKRLSSPAVISKCISAVSRSDFFHLRWRLSFLKWNSETRTCRSTDSNLLR